MTTYKYKKHLLKGSILLQDPRNEHLAGPWHDAGHFIAYSELVEVVPMLWIRAGSRVDSAELKWLRGWADLTPPIIHQIENKS